jgi:hypothetical protein
MAIILKPENVARLVFLIREEKVMLDADLAMLFPTFENGSRRYAVPNCDHMSQKHICATPRG